MSFSLTSRETYCSFCRNHDSFIVDCIVGFVAVETPLRIRSLPSSFTYCCTHYMLSLVSPPFVLYSHYFLPVSEVLAFCGTCITCLRVFLVPAFISAPHMHVCQQAQPSLSSILSTTECNMFWLCCECVEVARKPSFPFLPCFCLRRFTAMCLCISMSCVVRTIGHDVIFSYGHMSLWRLLPTTKSLPIDQLFPINTVFIRSTFFPSFIITKKWKKN